MTWFISFQAKTTIRFAWSLQAVVIGSCQTVCLTIFGDISRLGSCCFDHKVVHIKHLQIWNICSVDRIKKKNITTDLKFVDIAGSTLLYVFFYFGMHVYNVSVDGVTHLKTLKSEFPFQPGCGSKSWYQFQKKRHCLQDRWPIFNRCHRALWFSAHNTWCDLRDSRPVHTHHKHWKRILYWEPERNLYIQYCPTERNSIHGFCQNAKTN